MTDKSNADMDTVYTIRDNVADYFMPPFVAKNDNLAKRMFIMGMGDNFVHRVDFQLFSIGNFDSEDGYLIAFDPRLVMAGLSISEDLDPRPGPNIHFNGGTPS